jgi:glycosyltransferase involved in cell wall biosynthesis
MRIAQLAPTYERVPPRTYGGTELIVHLITEELVARGHEVTLFATGDSLTSARLRSVTPEPMRYGQPADGVAGHAEYLQLANAQAAFRAADDGAFDLVHNHAGVEGMVLAAGSRTPVISTMHNPYSPLTRSIWDAYPWFHHAVSSASAATFPTRGALPPILHGIDVASFPFEPTPAGGHLLFLGRFSKGKGAAAAVEAAQRAGHRLVLAGKIDAADAETVRETLEPQFDGERIRYVGEVDGDVKRDLLAAADALLFPIDWDEPFGLVMVEALSSGTPVIGFRRASVPEVVEDGRTGFIVDDLDGMVEAIGRIDEIDRRACRFAAESRFSARRMVDDVEAMYRSVLDRVGAGSVGV